MKIIIIGSSYPPKIGGKSYSLYYLYKNLKKDNHKITIFLCPYEFKSESEYPNYVKILDDFNQYIYLNLFKIFLNIIKYVKGLFRQPLRLKKKIRLFFKTCKNILNLIKMLNFIEIIKIYNKIFDYDVIYSHDSSYPAEIGYFLKKDIKKRFIVTSHGNDILMQGTSPLSLLALKKADKINVRSNYVKKLLLNLYKLDKKKIVVIPDGIIPKDQYIEKSKVKLREELNLSQKKFYMISVGTLYNKRKGFDIVLKCLKELRDSYDINIENIEYIIIGRKKKQVIEWLENIAETYNLTKNVKILPSLEDNLRNKYYKAADLFLMVSRNMKDKGSIEGFGRVFIEAAYYNLPTIGSNVGGIPETIENGKSGFIVSNFHELVEKIKLLYEDKDLRDKLGKYGHKRVMKDFTWKKIYMAHLKKLFS